MFTRYFVLFPIKFYVLKKMFKSCFMVLLSGCYYELGIQKQKRENYKDNTNHNENFEYFLQL